MTTEHKSPLRVGIGGPVGSGKTALLEKLCKAMRDDYHIAVVTNDIYTKEDAQFLTRSEALTDDHRVATDTSPAPHRVDGCGAALGLRCGAHRRKHKDAERN